MSDVEKVARAICDRLYSGDTAVWDRLGRELRDFFMELAKAALAAMGEREAVSDNPVTVADLDPLYGIVEALRETCTAEHRFNIAHSIAKLHKALAAKAAHASPRPEAVTYRLMRRAVLQEDEGNEHIIGTYPTPEAAEAAIEAESGGGYFKRGDFYVAAIRSGT